MLITHSDTINQDATIMAGKGDRLRPGANLNAFWENYDRAFSKRRTLSQWAAVHKDIFLDYDGFREYNSDDLMTEEEYKKCRSHCSTVCKSK